MIVCQGYPPGYEGLEWRMVDEYGIAVSSCLRESTTKIIKVVSITHMVLVLSPLETGFWILHEVFDFDYSDHSIS